MTTAQTLAAVALVACFVLAATANGRSLVLAVVRYHRWALRQPSERRDRRQQRTATGLCVRCGSAPQRTGDYCSTRCELNDDYEALGC